MWSETFMHYCDAVVHTIKGEELDMWYSNTHIHCVQSLQCMCTLTMVH